jgi:hypothetical protein
MRFVVGGDEDGMEMCKKGRKLISQSGPKRGWNCGDCEPHHIDSALLIFRSGHVQLAT